MDGLSPETRDLLDRAEGGDELPAARKQVLGNRIAGALGLAAPLASTHASTASLGKHGWLRGSSSWRFWPHVLGAIGIASVVSTVAVVVVGSSHRATLPGPTLPPTAFVTAPVMPENPTVVDPPSASPSAIAAPLAVPPATPTGVVPVVSAQAAAFPRRPRSALPAPPLAAAPSVVAPSVVAPSAVAPSVVAPSVVAPSVVALAASSDLAAEAHVLAEVQTALGAGRAAEALTLLNDYDARFPKGTLAPEGGALRVRALCASGRTDEARAQAQRLRARFPSVVAGSPCDSP